MEILQLVKIYLYHYFSMYFYMHAANQNGCETHLPTATSSTPHLPPTATTTTVTASFSSVSSLLTLPHNSTHTFSTKSICSSDVLLYSMTKTSLMIVSPTTSPHLSSSIAIPITLSNIVLSLTAISTRSTPASTMITISSLVPLPQTSSNLSHLSSSKNIPISELLHLQSALLSSPSPETADSSLSSTTIVPSIATSVVDSTYNIPTSTNQGI